ncbi:hypothetical protein INT45_000189 [Circinella minor]|uniref:Uncharacterized protein n=1 Tax=Circinella minor TaxID=1195481 RepID=A0A8H7S209_9FUNG|nr:hypothetical protein INT45_000189 [Circinella minor]
MNTLILSRLWHVLRLTGAPQGTFWKKLKSIIYKFMTHQTFPKPSFDQLCLPRSQGGVQLLDPQLQQHALCLRWLVPVLYYPNSASNLNNSYNNDLSSPTDITLPYIQTPELFSNILFSTFDRTSVQTDQLVLSPRLALQLPVCSTVQPQGNFAYTEITAQHSTIHKIKTDNIFFFDTNLQYLRPRFPADGHRQYLQISKKIVNSILAFKLQPRLFFARLCFDSSSPLASHSGDLGNNDASSLLDSCTLLSSTTPTST